MRIDVAKLDLALAHKEARQDCPVCGVREWTVDDQPAVVNATDPDTGEILLSAGVPAAILVCKNCGFIRLHAVDVLFAGEGG
jgi:hypothetical protein